MLYAYALTVVVGFLVLYGRRLSWDAYLRWLILAIPVLFIGLVGGFIVHQLLSGSWQGGALEKISRLALLILSAGLGARFTARTYDLAYVARGTALLPEAATTRGLSKVDSPALGLSLAGVAIPLSDETRHFKMMGTTGTGKTTAIVELLGAALARGDRAIFADPDGGYRRRFFSQARGDLILNPLDQASVCWDLFAEITTEYDIDQLARSLMPDEEGSDRAWLGYARTYFASVMEQLWKAGVTDTAQLHRVITLASVEELQILLEGTPAQSFLQAGNERLFGSIRGVATSHLAPLRYLSSSSSTPFSVRRWVSEGQGVLFLPYSAQQIAALRSLISTWMRLAIFQAMSLPEGDHKIWFVVDELDALGRMDGLKDALARLRKFGGRCVLGFQSLAQVSSTYGRGEAQTIVENCSNTLVLRCSASERGGTAEFASTLIGQRELVRTEWSISEPAGLWASLRRAGRTRSQRRSTEAAVLASQIEQLADGQGFLKLASSPAWRRVRLQLRG